MRRYQIDYGGYPMKCSAYLLIAVILLAGCSSTPAAPTSVPATPTRVSVAPTPLPTVTEQPPFQEDFDTVLQPGWTWNTELVPSLDLSTSPGFLHYVLQNDPLELILLRDPGSTDFEISTHVLFEPTSNFQFAGLIVFEDAQTVAHFGRLYCDIPGACVGNGIYFEGAQEGQYVGPNLGSVTEVKNEAWLRLTKAGTLFTAYFSADGHEWSLIGTHEFSMENPKVGIRASASTSAGIVADFDLFTILNKP
jgi:regulation of enolase protein 1 (concanavalin A-like superfamily)